MIYHLAVHSEWEQQLASDEYSPSAFAHEYFIHACHARQLDAVYRRYYTGRHDLWLLEIDEARLWPRVIEEASTGGELYPHIYGKINKEAIVSAMRYPGSL